MASKKRTKKLKTLPTIHVRPMAREEKKTLGQVKKKGITHGSEYEVRDQEGGKSRRVVHITKGRLTRRGERVGQRADRRYRDNKDNTGARPTGPRGPYNKKQSRLPKRPVGIQAKQDDTTKKPETAQKTQTTQKPETTQKHQAPTKQPSPPTKHTAQNPSEKDSTKQSSENSSAKSEPKTTQQTDRKSTKKGFVRRAWDSTKDRVAKSKTRDIAQKSSSEVVNAVGDVVNRLNRPDHIK